MNASAETPGTTPEHPTDTDAAVTAVIAGWNDRAHDEPASPSDTGAAASAHARPTVRWGALVWSLLFGALAGTALWIMLDPDRREATGEWLTTLSPLAAALYAVVVLGIIVALFGIVGLIRRGERATR
ncbi:hypothetical protein [Agromyces ramosus]|uniref:Uncharacterized protein n=1 Tax=Agromyces ramosus TaxID=33879 RepID=A0ABU0R9E9_9MICO|nr:hypothetical protein [Agromyces ramosus]MDQ0894707.1 hypothetical protein [Agromyces ramosus]